MKHRVLVTRPQPGNAETCTRLAEAGFQPLALPLTRIVSVDCPPVERLPDAVAVTSPNAIRHASGQLLTSLQSAPVFAVGETSAGIARQAGLTVVATGPGDAGALAEILVSQLKSGAEIAYPCGHVRKPGFETCLTGAGLNVWPLPTYNTEKVSYSTNMISEHLGCSEIDFVMLHSVKSAEALISLKEAEYMVQLTDKTRYICLSPRIAKALDGTSLSMIETAERPFEALMIALLGKP